jgi:hypothetical protein
MAPEQRGALRFVLERTRRSHAAPPFTDVRADRETMIGLCDAAEDFHARTAGEDHA